MNEERLGARGVAVLLLGTERLQLLERGGLLCAVAVMHRESVAVEQGGAGLGAAHPDAAIEKERDQAVLRRMPDGRFREDVDPGAWRRAELGHLRVSGKLHHRTPRKREDRFEQGRELRVSDAERR